MKLFVPPYGEFEWRPVQGIPVEVQVRPGLWVTIGTVISTSEERRAEGWSYWCGTLTEGGSTLMSEPEADAAGQGFVSLVSKMISRWQKDADSYSAQQRAAKVEARVEEWRDLDREFYDDNPGNRRRI